MSVLNDLIEALRGARVEVIDLTASLNSATPVLQLPEPPVIGSGPATTTAPVAGSRARFCSWVRPYLPAPSSAEWHGNGGSNE